MPLPDALWIALSGPVWVTIDRLVGWLRNRRKDNAEAGLAVDARWEKYADKMEERIAGLETRVTDLETERSQLRERIKGLIAEVDRYKTIARSLARHVLRLRDSLNAASGELPALPTDIEDALTIIDMP